jgi:DNA repair exonuclease SbcCD nuclease subunit
MHFPFTMAKVSDQFAIRAGLPKQVFDGVKFKKALMGDIHRAQILGEEQKTFYPGSPTYISRAESDEKGFWVHDLSNNTQEFIALHPEPLPELTKTIQQPVERQAVTDKVVIKDLLQTQFQERTGTMISMLEELGMGDVLNSSVYATKKG